MDSWKLHDEFPQHSFPFKRAIMSFEPNGELVPVGGGDSIRLVRPQLTIGRRASCDICLHFPNISGIHCELSFTEGCWAIRDLNSTNGIKVNGIRVKKKILRPGDTLSIAKRQFTIAYEFEPGRHALAEFLEESEEELNTEVPLLEKAGLVRPRNADQPRSIDKPRSVDKPKSVDKPRARFEIDEDFDLS
jgi:adenylate cyclase